MESFFNTIKMEFIKEFVAEKNGRRYHYYIIRSGSNYYRIYSVKAGRCVFRRYVLYVYARKYLDAWLRSWADNVIEKPF